MSFFMTVITPTYNRRELVVRSIDSTLQFIKLAQFNIELIVVDDASTDKTSEYLEDKYRRELETGEIKLIRSRVNQGVTGARNLGSMHAKGEWLLLIDSDDLLVRDVAQDMLTILKHNDRYPIIFFRCIELSTGKLIGPYRNSSYQLPLKSYLHFGTPGECVPAIKTSQFLQIMYDPSLRGCEGLTYAKMIQKFGPAQVEQIIVRKYNTTANDRLSSGRGYIDRACFIGKYHRIILADFFNDINTITRIKTVIKIVCYWLACLVFKPEKK